MYSIVVARDVLDELGDVKRYSAKIFRQIALKILELSFNARPSDVKRIGDGYRVRSGDYRIYYEAVDDKERTIIVLVVGKRGDDEVYRRLRRKLGSQAAQYDWAPTLDWAPNVSSQYSRIDT